MDYLEKARWVLNNEIDGLAQVRDELGEGFVSLVKTCQDTLHNKGKIILCGIGKSGHIGRKISATLASTGSPSVFMHPVEAMHGDLGLMRQEDLLILISYSGETTELLEIVPAARRLEVTIVAITGNDDSSLATYADINVKVSVSSEACPFNLAPTTSTTAALAFGDALAIVLMEASDFNKDEYAKLHPSGAIGRSITLKVQDIMRVGERAPVVKLDTTVKDSIVTMTKCRAGSVLIVDDEGILKGIFTDGDFRRHAQENLEVLELNIDDVMTKNPTTLKADQLAVAILKLLEEKNINDVPVVDDGGKAIGLVDIQDLPKFKLM